MMLECFPAMIGEGPGLNFITLDMGDGGGGFYRCNTFKTDIGWSGDFLDFGSGFNEYGGAD